MSAPNDPAVPQPSPDAIARTIARHPRPLGGDTQRATGASVLDLTGSVLNNQSAAAHHLRIQRKPDWLRARVPGGEGYERLKAIIDEHRLHTVCQEASCPNMGECWGRIAHHNADRQLGRHCRRIATPQRPNPWKSASS